MYSISVIFGIDLTDSELLSKNKNKNKNCQEKIFTEISEKKFQTFHCSNVTTMKILGEFSRNVREDFFLKISIYSAKVYTINIPNIKGCSS